jgi:hypothetical protein
MGASRDLWVLLKELFEIPDTRDFDVVERLSDDPRRVSARCRSSP